jgi:hypothetical protein
MRFSTSAMTCRAIGPAEADGAERINLRKGPGHDDILACIDEFDPGGVIVPRDVFGIGGVNHEQDIVTETARAAP